MLKILFDIAKDILWDDWDSYISYEEKLLLDLEAIQQEKEKIFRKMEKSRKKLEKIKIERSNYLYHMELEWLECAKFNSY